MNLPNKKLPGARGIPQPLNRPAGQASHFKPVVAQLKNPVSAQIVKRPVAPPVYPPHATTQAAQLKMADAGDRKSPIGSPVYLPQQMPRVLQTKRSAGQSTRADQTPRQPVARPVDRPEVKKIVPPKAISMLHTSQRGAIADGSTQTRITRPKMSLAAPVRGRPHTHPGNIRHGFPIVSEPTGRPRGGQWSSTVQRAEPPEKKVKVNPISTKVILSFGDFVVHGSNGQDTGHAEMDAIDQFIIACGNADLDPVKEFNKRKKNLKVQCEAKDICVRCGCVLKALGFKAKNKKTVWGIHTMDLTEWAVTPAVKSFLAKTAPGKYEQAKAY